METSSLQKHRPHLESVFGALSEEDDSYIRLLLTEVDTILLDIAKYFGHNRAGSEGTGLELIWMPSGQTYIRSDVCAMSGSSCVEFGIEVAPSWCFGNKSSNLTWEIETSVRADCSHSIDHGGMDTVHEIKAKADSAIDSALMMKSAAKDLERIAKEFSLEHWLALASDRNV